MFLFFDPNTHTKLYGNFQNIREKYKGTKFTNESNFVAPSQILMFRFKQRKHMYLRQNVIICV